METKVFVGTYWKYNTGYSRGEWLTLSDYASKEEFLEACHALHEDESDPELMFHDTQGPTFGMISEDEVDGDIFLLLSQLNAAEIAMYEAYRKNVGEGTFSDAEEAYMGKWESDIDFAESLADDLGYTNKGDSWPYTCIDWKQAARELMWDYHEQDGHYFRNL
jgi:antirestriction protein